MYPGQPEAPRPPGEPRSTDGTLPSALGLGVLVHAVAHEATGTALTAPADRAPSLRGAGDGWHRRVGAQVHGQVLDGERSKVFVQGVQQRMKPV
jgi:hypothetical protein